MGAQIAQGNTSAGKGPVSETGVLSFDAPLKRNLHQQPLSLHPQPEAGAGISFDDADNTTQALSTVPAWETAAWLYPTAVVGPALLVVTCGVLRHFCGRKEEAASQPPLDRLVADNAVESA
ncbi:MAG: hypothetical protein V4684_00900 [Pseudomonadota bacterium]